MRTRLGLALLSFAGSLPALARSGSPPLLPSALPTVLELAPGVGGPAGKNGGPGNEQPAVVSLVSGGERYVVTVFMSSAVEGGDRPWQCKCSSVRLRADAPPEVVADQIQLTQLKGNRPCNHPAAAADGDHIVWLFGSNHPNANNVATLAGVLDARCGEVVAPARVSENAGNNEGAPDVVANGGGDFTAGYLSTGNNKDRTYALGLHFDPQARTLDKTYLQPVVAPANIGRPAIVALSPTRSLVCAAKGNQRPPEIGVECALVDAHTGRSLWKQLVAPSQPAADKTQPGVYMNQPQLARMDDDRVALQVIESSGQGKNKNKKGVSKAHLYVLSPDDAGPHVLGERAGIGSYQAHATVCAGHFGQGSAAAPAVGVFEAPITGGGLPLLTLARFDRVTVAEDPATTMMPRVMASRVLGGERADSGYLSNLYGRNPKNQGREFLRCIGDVPNPGFGVGGGFRPDVRSFFVAPYTGRKDGEPKNALFLSLLAGQVDPAAAGGRAAAMSVGKPARVAAGAVRASGPADLEGGCAVMPGRARGKLGGLLLAAAIAIASVRRRRR
jgi:hypothetical protein